MGTERAVYGTERVWGGLSSSASSIVVHGDIDITATAELIDAVRRALRQGDGDIRLDLRHVTFVDVVGVTALLQCRRMAATQDRRLWLVEPSPDVERILGLIGVAPMFDRCSDSGERQ